MKNYIYSTLSQDVIVTNYEEQKDINPGGILTPRHKVLIKGGAHVIVKARSGEIQTPKGSVTEISDNDLIECKKNVVFNRLVENGFLTIDTNHKKSTNPDLVSKNMTAKDKSAQPTKEDFEKESGEGGAKIKSVGNLKL